jgi:hypothetical protein
LRNGVKTPRNRTKSKENWKKGKKEMERDGNEDWNMESGVVTHFYGFVKRAWGVDI